MKKIITLVCFVLIQFSVLAQSDINGDFEEWDSYDFPLPHNWTYVVANTPCGPFSVPLEQTDDNYSGNWAVKLESKVCYNPFGQLRLKTGRAYTSETEDSLATQPTEWSRPYIERPEELSFYYKFHQEGTDSAAVYLLLFNYDNETHFVDTIGVTSGFIHNETTEYTEFILPIDYYKENAPSFVHILFVTSKTIADLGILEYDPAYENAYPGTTFLVDNVMLRGGTVNTESPENKVSHKVFPNPFTDELHIDIRQDIQIHQITIHDNQGRIIRQYDEPDTILKMNDIPKGIYYLKLKTSEGIRFEKIVKR